MKTVLTGRLLLLLSLGIWIGSMIFFAVGIAPETFQLVREWQLRGIHPSTGQLVSLPKTMGGYFTSVYVAELNRIGLFCLFSGSFGLFLSWFPKEHRSMYLMTKTLLFFAMGIVHYIMVFVISDEMFRLLHGQLLDFDSTQVIPEVVAFRNLHGWYSRLAVLQVLLALGLSLTVTFKPFQNTGTSLK
jgi:hypothetical protein